MNIFPTNIQYFITKKHFENKKEIILLYTDPNYTNEELIRYYYPEKIQGILNNEIFNEAAKHGNIRLMKWLKANECPWDSETFEYAVIHGNLENMKWLKANGCPWDSSTFTYAADHGNLENMKWLKENGCPWNAITFEAAAENGNLENMKWLKENGCPLGFWAHLKLL
jgi:hypothetical protein